MTDEENDPELPSTPPRKKKKRRRVVADDAPREASPVVAEAQAGPYTATHLAAALAVGVAAGALGGFLAWGKGAAPGVAKDTPSQAASQVAGATARPQQPTAPQPPAGPVYIALAPWSPREGPEHAKVTIVEFSDFQ